MSGSTARLLRATALALAAAGCASGPELGPLDEFGGALPAGADPSGAVPAALRPAGGDFAPEDPVRAARPGDWILARASLIDGEGVTRRFVRLTLVEAAETRPVQRDEIGNGPPGEELLAFLNDPPEGVQPMLVSDDSGVVLFAQPDRRARVRVELFDERGRRLDADETRIETELHVWQRDVEAGADVGYDGLLELVRGSRVAGALLGFALDRPNPFQALFGGAGLDVELGPIEGRRPAGAERPAHERSVRLRIGGRPALDGRLETGWKRWPYLLTAGVRRAEARHPIRADRRVVIEVLGGSRGPAPGAAQESAPPDR